MFLYKAVYALIAWLIQERNIKNSEIITQIVTSYNEWFLQYSNMEKVWSAWRWSNLNVMTPHSGKNDVIGLIKENLAEQKEYSLMFCCNIHCYFHKARDLS